MMRWLLATAAILIPLSLHAQQADLSGDNVISTWPNALPSSLATRFGQLPPNVKADFGAAMDGTTDDSTPYNNARIDERCGEGGKG